jgi:protein-disulfide isomerase
VSKKKNRRSKAAPDTSTSTTSSATSPTSDDTAEEDAAAAVTRKQRRSEKILDQREARKTTGKKKDQGVKPWILPGFVGIAVIAIVLVGMSALSNDGGESAGSNVANPVLGEPTAQVVIHEYGDFQCAFCGVFSRNIKPELKARFFDTGIARLVWHDFAWYGRESLTAANAARCAGEQDMFWEYHDVLFVNQRGENQGAFSNENVKFFGEQLGLETASFDQCVDDNRYRDAIDADGSRVRRLGLNGTPSFIIGDPSSASAQRIVGAQSVEVFEQAIEAELIRAG